MPTVNPQYTCPISLSKKKKKKKKNIDKGREARQVFLTPIPEMKIAEFANSVDLDEVTHNESPHLDLHCLPSSL